MNNQLNLDLGVEQWNEPEQGTVEWHEWRKLGIGATDASAIIGASKWGTALSIYVDKTTAKPEASEPNAVQEWGNRIEPLLLDKFMDQHPEATDLTRGGLFTTEWRRCSLDGHCIIDGKPAIIECKTARSDDDWEPVPTGYYAQIQWQMHVTGFRRAFFSVLVRGCDWFEREVDYDPEYCAKLEAACAELWARIQNGGPAPEPQHVLADVDGKALATLRTVALAENDAPLAHQVEEADVMKFHLLKSVADEALKRFEAHKADLLYRMRDGGDLMHGETKFAYYVKRAGATSVDRKLLATAYPEVYKAVTRQGPPITYPLFR